MGIEKKIAITQNQSAEERTPKYIFEKYEDVIVSSFLLGKANNILAILEKELNDGNCFKVTRSTEDKLNYYFEKFKEEIQYRVSRMKLSFNN